jgi:hypothetical protein
MRARMTASVMALVFGAGAAHGLEIRRVEATTEFTTGWDTGATCSVSYANTCTGWRYVWGGWEEGERVGVVFEPCCGNGLLVGTQVFFTDGAPSGYGYTGTLAISEAISGDCPGAPYQSLPFVPSGVPYGGRAFVHSWSGIPPGPVVLTYTFTDDWRGYNPTVPTDAPAGGPTGPQSCGLCYPSSRPTHTFYFGTAVSPLCPGWPFNDGVCDAELLHWNAQFSCTVAVERATWGSLKNLYR